MTSNWDKFALLLWKNFLIHKRHPWRTLFEIGLPILVFSIMLMVPSSPRTVPPQRFLPFGVDGGDRIPDDLRQLAYSPNNPVLQEIVNKTCKILSIPKCDGFNSSLDMQKVLQLNNSNYLCGIDFGDHSKSLSKLSNATAFKLRFPSKLRYESPGNPESDWSTDQLSAEFSASNYNPASVDGGPPHYWQEQFLAVQSALSRVLIAELAPEAKLPQTMNLRRFPYPASEDNDLFALLPYLVSIWLRLVFMYFFINSVKYIAVEKETQLKESMKLMGLSGWIQWSAWFVDLLLKMLIPVTAITVMLKVSVFPHSNPFLIWSFLSLYCAAVICLCFLVSVVFNTATRATTLASLLWVASFFNLPKGAPFWSKLLYSLLTNPAMGFGIDDIIRLETAGVGLTFKTLFKMTDMDNTYSLFVAVLMLLVNIVLYLLLTVYLEQIMPGTFGVARPWYFPVTADFWRRKSSAGVDPLAKPTETSRYFEVENQSLEAGVKIRNLRKVYGGGKVAVDELNLNLYEGQITVLLGHNGAGKTTTMSMLTGMFSPSSGTALVNGYDIRRHMNDVRASMGFCPQHNVLFDELTVREHLLFAARLKGASPNDVDAEVHRYISRLGLPEKADAQSCTLSGGMKRKLSVGMAMCGGPKVVLLDEPSTGVDPTARHALWDFLHDEKRDKTVLLSTHYMNEADVLGDRIAILADGRLSASGSPFFLKNAFGVGYRLVCVKGPKYSEALLLQTLRAHIPSIKIDHDTSTEVELLLEKKYTESFERMLQDLEIKMQKCGVMSYGVSFTTLEEVFMKAGTEAHLRPENNSTQTTEDAPQLESRTATEPHSLLIDSASHQSTVATQLRAQLLKKFLYTKRSWMQFLWTTFIVPIVIMILFAFPIKLSFDKSLPALEISLGSYDQSVSVIEKFNGSVASKYQGLFHGGNKWQQVQNNMESYIVEKYNHSILEYNTELLVGASFADDSYTGWFNAKQLHSAPLALNLIFNAILHTVCPSCSITPINHPLPREKSNDKDDSMRLYLQHLNIALAIIFIMAYVPSSYITFYIRERTSRVKLMQMVSGLRTGVFWFVNILWDLMTFTLTCMVILIMLFCYQVGGWSEPQSVFTLFVIFIVFALATLPLIYAISFMVNNPAAGYSRVLLIIGIGAIGLLLVYLLFMYLEFKKLADLIAYGFLFVPTISLFFALERFSTYTENLVACKQYCNIIPNCTLDQLCDIYPQCCTAYSKLFSFGTSGMLKELCAMIATGVICFFLIWCIERQLFYRIWSRIFPTKDYRYTVPQPQMDSDVLLEKSRVSQMSDTDIANHSLVLRNLTKNFGPVSAVKWLSLGTQPSECFGLLGVNGAGKTTAFRMMTGDETISFGDVWINGISVKSNLSQVYQHVGYCPQFDALLDELTGLETLRIFAMLRGIPRDDIDSIVRSLAAQLGFTKHLNKPIREYSGGTKRKLSTAQALIGSPSVIFLDEPSSGMDPGAKRQLWNVINRMRDAGRTIVLTTHSMDECEALCTRLAIMVGGEFKCLGSTQHLKNKFSGGFLLNIKMLSQLDEAELTIRTEAVKSFVAERFRDAVLKEDLQKSLSYHIPRSDLTWSAMFGIMEASKDVLGIEEYSLGQTTLEQVFLVFANNSGW